MGRNDHDPAVTGPGRPERIEGPAPAGWIRRALTDRREILAFLESDRLYAAYAIGDLEPGLFEDCTWAGAERDGRLQVLVLHYRGLDPPALLLIGATGSGDDGGAAGLRAVLAAALCPERVYLTCRPEHLALAREFYSWEAVAPMWRMALPPGGFRPVDSGDCQRLAVRDAEELAALYTRGGGLAFSPAQMERGLFHGIYVEEQLVAAAGTHLVSYTYGLAAVGNVFTHPEHRGQGYASAATSAVVAELLGAGIGEIILNVGQGNATAIGIYERLGFERYCPFLEGPATRIVPFPAAYPVHRTVKD